jgi:hypothetical protein
MTVVNGLWIGDRLSPLERACVQSFLQKGYDFHLYCYEPVAGVPVGCTVRDANSILPEDRIIRYAKGAARGSVALFADMFRYRLLHEIGGWWVDMDVFCLTESLPDEGVVLGRQDSSVLNCAVMRFPPRHDAMQVAYETCVARGLEADLNDVGPDLLTDLARRFRLSDCEFPPQVFYPLHYTEFWFVLDPRRTAYAAGKIRDAACVHLWNNLLTQTPLGKDVLPPEGSLLRNLYEWTIGTDGFRQELVLSPSSPPDGLNFSIIDRQ